MDQNKNTVRNEAVASRRKFLTKATAGLVIASLPAKSVWATNMTGSIVASGNSSVWNEDTRIALLSHGYWKNHDDWQRLDSAWNPGRKLKNESFKNVFGMRPLDDSGLGIRIKKQRQKDDGSYQYGWYHPKLKDIIGCEGDSGVKIELGNGWEAIADSSVNPTYLRTHQGVPKFDLSGPDNVNVQMIAMLLNAMYHGTLGLHYPMIGMDRPFASEIEFGLELGYLATADKFGAGQLLDDLIITYHA